MSTPKCPRCGTAEYVVLDKTATLAGGTIGAAAGAAIGSVVPVVGTFLGGLAGGILGALGGAAAGATTGALAGGAIDKCRSTYKCNKCKKEFDG